MKSVGDSAKNNARKTAKKIIKMRVEEKKSVKNSISRLAFVVLSVCLQVLWIIALIVKVNEYYAEISVLTSVAAFVAVLLLYGKEGNMALKMPWIMLILVFPVWGLSFYLLCGQSFNTRKMQRRFEQLDMEMRTFISQDKEITRELAETNKAIANQSHYIWKYGQAPMYRDTKVDFFAEAVDGFEAQLEDIKAAKDFIFMEYFAIEDGEAFSKMKEILVAKVKEGVEVRIFYDDVGSVGFVNPKFARELQELGIQCRIFNPLIPLLNMFMNNRDHRKITVIDGKIAYTGGYNLANEYFNYTHPFGYWKDTGVRLEGEAVRTFTLMLLKMWNVMDHTDLSYERFFPQFDKKWTGKSYVQPYGVNPLNGEHLGENIYMNIIKNARRYVYFVTPYLIITDEMKKELGLAAKRGVDVRILTPGIPDKKMIYRITRSYYTGLVKDGVRIFEYTPGFCHAKECICDDEVAVIGTINMDYRSLYLHFEDGVYLYQTEAIAKMYQDYQDMLSVSEEVTDKYLQKVSTHLSIGQSLLRIIAPLL